MVALWYPYGPFLVHGSLIKQLTPKAGTLTIIGLLGYQDSPWRLNPKPNGSEPKHPFGGARRPSVSTRAKEHVVVEQHVRATEA